MIEFPKDVEKLQTGPKLRQPYFLKETFGTDGKIKLEEPKLLNFQDPLARATFAVRAKRYIFEVNEYYYVIGNVYSTVFTIINREVLFEDDEAESGETRNTPKKTDFEKFLHLRSCKKRVICTVSFTEQVVLRGEQIFFVVKGQTHIYTPFSTSIIDVPSLAIASDYFLYILSPESIHVYGTQFIKQMALQEKCKRIVVIYETIFLFQDNDIHRVGKDGSVQSFKAPALIRKVSTGSYHERHGISCVSGPREKNMLRKNAVSQKKYKIYILLSTKNLLELDVRDMRFQVIGLGHYFRELMVSDSLVIVYDRLSGYKCFDRDTLTVMHSASVDPALRAIAAYKSEVCFLTKYYMVSVGDYKPWCEQLLLEPSTFFSECMAVSSLNKPSLEDEINMFFDDTEENREIKLDSIPAFLEKIPDAESEPSSDASTYFYESTENAEVERQFQSYEEILKQCTFKNNRSPDPKHPSGTPAAGPPDSNLSLSFHRTMAATGISNPTQHRLFVDAIASPGKLEIFHKRCLLRYKKTCFFIKNFTRWLKRGYNPHPEEAVPLEYPTFKYLSELVLRKEKKTGVSEAPRSAIINTRRGGF